MAPRVGIIGYGYVGKAMYSFFSNRYDTVWCDLGRGVSHDEINTCDVGVVCVNTPSAAGGEADLSQVEGVLEWLRTPLIILKSSVPPGTCAKIKKGREDLPLVFSPEFVGEATYHCPGNTVIDSSYFLFGGDEKDTTRAAQLYAEIGGPSKRYIQTSFNEAEMAKYLTNTFLAMKTTYCYEMAEVCKVLDVDYDKVRELWLLDERVGRSHTSVFSTNTRPYSGKCFPKDVQALVEQSAIAGYEAALLREVHESNERLGEKRRRK